MFRVTFEKLMASTLLCFHKKERVTVEKLDVDYTDLPFLSMF